MLTKQTDFQALLSKGFSARPARMEDADAVAEMLNAHSQALMGVNSESAEAVVNFWETPGVDIDFDTLMILDEQGNLAGYSDVYDANDPHVHIYSCGFVRPDLFGIGVGSALADWLVERGMKGLGRAPEGARVVLVQFAPVEDGAAGRILESRGFEHVRGSYQMRIDLDEEPAEPAALPGITICPIDMQRDFAEAVRTIRVAFRDHYGFVEEPFDQSLRRWQHLAATDPHFDPTVFFVAKVGDAVAGVCYCTPHTEEDDTMAWVNTLGVRRDWRGRGIGHVLLRTAFREFYKRGFRKVGLGVDAQSLTGATRLYEKAGMYVARQYNAYEKEIRPGIELSTQNLE